MLKKPALTPPSWVFSPVWTVLYFMMFLSVLIFIRDNSFKIKVFPLVVFVLQLALNLSWSPVFFGMKNIKGAFLIVSILLVLVGLNIYLFSKTSVIAGVLLVPYFLWTAFATYLNFGLLKLNP
ncbi:tryptophan-rich sensory protein [bacterium]|nr:tryptophan-rich sensory protein [bacterium]